MEKIHKRQLINSMGSSMGDKIKQLSFGDILGILSLVITLGSFVYWFGVKSTELDMRLKGLEKNQLNSELILYRLQELDTKICTVLNKNEQSNTQVNKNTYKYTDYLKQDGTNIRKTYPEE